jgi:Flp pilus assembly pilin Flp
VIAGLISIVILTVMTQIGQTVLSFFQDMIAPFV